MLKSLKRASVFEPHRSKRIKLFVILVTLAFLIDVLSKWWVGTLFDASTCPYPECTEGILAYGKSCKNVEFPHIGSLIPQSKEIISEFFYLHLLNNTGAAWSFLSGRNYLFIIFNSLFTVGAIYYICRPKGLPLNSLISFSLIIGGAFGNFYDRLVHGSVRDFLSFLIPLPGGEVYSYPVFNMADVFICVGAIYYLIDQFFLVPKKEIAKKDTSPSEVVRDES